MNVIIDGIEYAPKEPPRPKTVMVEILVEDAEYFLTLTPPPKVLMGRYEVASNNFWVSVFHD